MENLQIHYTFLVASEMFTDFSTSNAAIHRYPAHHPQKTRLLVHLRHSVNMWPALIGLDLGPSERSRSVADGEESPGTIKYIAAWVVWIGTWRGRWWVRGWLGRKFRETCSCDVRSFKMVLKCQESGLLTFQVKIRIVDLIYGGWVFHLATSYTLSLNASLPSPKTEEVVEWREN